MTFPEYFQACQTLIAKEIDLPFDCPFPQRWIDEHTVEFKFLNLLALTPEKAVRLHFAGIDRKALLTKVKKNKSTI